VVLILEKYECFMDEETNAVDKERLEQLVNKVGKEYCEVIPCRIINNFNEKHEFLHCLRRIAKRGSPRTNQRTTGCCLYRNQMHE
jgi:hypothetical protein